LNLVEIPKNLNSQQWGEVFENCVKFHGMIPMAFTRGTKKTPLSKTTKTTILAQGAMTRKI